MLTGDTGYIWRAGAIMLVFTLVQVVFAVAAVYFGAQVAMGFGRDVRGDLFHQVTDFSAREVGHFGAPSLITRITNDVQQVQMLVVMACTMAIAAPDHDGRRRRSWRCARTSACRSSCSSPCPSPAIVLGIDRRAGWCRRSG